MKTSVTPVVAGSRRGQDRRQHASANTDQTLSGLRRVKQLTPSRDEVSTQRWFLKGLRKTVCTTETQSHTPEPRATRLRVNP